MHCISFVDGYLLVIYIFTFFQSFIYIFIHLYKTVYLASKVTREIFRCKCRDLETVNM